MWVIPSSPHQVPFVARPTCGKSRKSQPLTSPNAQGPSLSKGTPQEGVDEQRFHARSDMLGLFARCSEINKVCWNGTAYRVCRVQVQGCRGLDQTVMPCCTPPTSHYEIHVCRPKQSWIERSMVVGSCSNDLNFMTCVAKSTPCDAKIAVLDGRRKLFCPEPRARWLALKTLGPSAYPTILHLSVTSIQLTNLTKPLRIRH